MTFLSEEGEKYLKRQRQEEKKARYLTTFIGQGTEIWIVFFTLNNLYQLNDIFSFHFFLKKNIICELIVVGNTFFWYDSQVLL